MIDIEHLPRHDFLNYCKNCLLDIVAFADKNHLTKATISFKTEEDKQQYQKACIIQGEDTLTWLLTNDYKETAYELCYKHLFFSLVVDFSNYYISSIESAFNNNINVAWALLRKPLQETLAYIEWLYVDREELLKLMLEGEKPEKYEILRLKDKIKKHIDEIRTPESAEIDMYEFRYSYNTEFTINGILQATNHLITSRPALKTAPSGLNFIFPDKESVDRNIGFYYTTTPYVMLYAMEIITKMFSDIANLTEYTVLINDTNLKLKNLAALPTTYDKAKELLSLNDICIYCPRCGRKFNSDKVWFTFANKFFRCKRCFKKIQTNGYLFDFDDISFVTKQ